MRESNISIKIVLIILGIMLIVLGGKSVADTMDLNSEWERFKTSAVKTEATVTNISTYNSAHNYSVSVCLKYNDAEGSEHTATIDHRFKGCTEGAQVTIYYDKEYPKDVMTDPSDDLKAEKKINAVIFAGGILLIAAGVFVSRYERSRIV